MRKPKHPTGPRCLRHDLRGGNGDSLEADRYSPFADDQKSVDPEKPKHLPTLTP
ncbi:MAG: hypothetical protein JXR10_18265 [Cyclobacteriaceae bacterium]